MARLFTAVCLCVWVCDCYGSIEVCVCVCVVCIDSVMDTSEQCMKEKLSVNN